MTDHAAIGMSSTLRSLIEEEFERAEEGRSKRARKARKRARRKATGRFQLAAEAKTADEEKEERKRRTEEALEAILGLDEGAKVQPELAVAVAGYKRRPLPEKKKKEKKNKKRKEGEGGSVFTDEDFERWGKAYFINSKLDNK